ncbi:hypothetical protein SCLCIDRAFT_1224533 [Scleroderma citrinum Foug A]|uniref:Uncharacterized protein n=1 Tax=Scleroderma citrinum Foug A TaxID=1036808 RepID=A0A0C2ZEU7_9AGAM|nr:hypothetical protein SCLCIDRAFT_1224533 [Scleroderma citrinum Foug A]
MDYSDSDFITSLLPDSVGRPNKPNRHPRPIDVFYDIVRKLPNGAIVIELEYFGWNKGPKKLHHFLCATIKLPGGSILKAVIQRSPIDDTLPRKLVGSKQCVAVDEFIVFDRDHPNFNHQPISRCIQKWDARNSPSLLQIATAAKTVSEAARYQLYRTQCIWYALTVFDLVAREFYERGCPVIFIRLTERTLSKLLKRNNFTQLSAVLGENLQKCHHPSSTSTYPSAVGPPMRTPHHSAHPSTAFPVEGPVPSVLPTDTATELGSIISVPSTYESSGMDTTTTPSSSRALQILRKPLRKLRLSSNDGK